MNANYKTGLMYALICAVLWGVLPIYWDALNPIGSFVIIFYRIFLMWLTCFGICFYQHRNIKTMFSAMFEDKKKMWVYIMAGIVITINWSIYIWAVKAGFVIQCSMGYFLEPLVVCIFGMVIYKEKANKWKKISLCLGLIGLLVMVIGYKELPLVSVGLGLSFAVYAAIKKSVNLPPFQSLLYETLFIAPVALIVCIYLEGAGIGAMAAGGLGKYALMLFAGLVTAIPLGLFSSAANKLPLFTLGLTEYISPSISLVLGIFFFREPFELIEFSAFLIVWVGLIFFSYGEVKSLEDSANLSQN